MGTMVPTARFRYVERQIDPQPDKDEAEYVPDPVLVLQQWCTYPGSEKGEWYEIPIEGPTTRNWR